MWVQELSDMIKSYKEKNDNFDLFEKVNNVLGRLNAYNHVEDRIVFLNIVNKDIVEMLPTWITESAQLQEP
jgi:hypothetical protein